MTTENRNIEVECNTRDDSLTLERNNSRRIERLETDVNEIRQDLAAMPGRIVTELERRHPPSERFNALAWAFGVILTIIGAISWNFYTADNRNEALLNNIAEKMLEHVQDGHPLRVEENVSNNHRLILDLKNEIESVDSWVMEHESRVRSLDADQSARIAALEKHEERAYEEIIKDTEMRGRVKELIIELRRDFEILREGQNDRFTGEEGQKIRDKMDALERLLLQEEG